MQTDLPINFWIVLEALSRNENHTQSSELAPHHPDAYNVWLENCGLDNNFNIELKIEDKQE